MDGLAGGCFGHWLYDNPSIFDGTHTSPVAADASGGFIPVVDQFRYLGTITDKTLDDGTDVDKNISKASQAVGALRKPIFGPRYTDIGTNKQTNKLLR